MRVVIVLLCLLGVSGAHAVTSQELEDACFAKIKPLVKDKATKVTRVTTKPPENGRRGRVWHVTFDFNRKLLNDNTSAWCMFKEDGTPWGDDYEKHLEAQNRLKEQEALKKKAEMESKQKAARYN